MRFVRDSPLELGFRVWQLRPPTPSLTVIAKGTFDISSAGPARFADEPVTTTGEAHVDEDVEQPLARPDDFALLKPVGEAFVVGRAWAPRGVPTTAVACSFRIGPVEKRFVVFGDRHWRRGLVVRASEPEPFTSMPIHMGRAYGGPDFEDNPWGRGRVAVQREDGSEVVPLPNVERTDRLLDSPNRAVEPVVVGPYPMMWPARQGYSGTYGGDYLETRWPWLPADFDWRFFLAAPADQRLREGFWRGDERVEVEGLHPEHATLRSTLPKIDPRIFVDRIHPSTGAREFTEVPKRLDTVIWDAEIGRLLLIWRGSIEIRDESLDDVRHLFVAHDPLDGPKRSVEALRARQDEMLAAEAEEERDAEGQPPPEAGVAAAEEDDGDTPEPEVEATVEDEAAEAPEDETAAMERELAEKLAAVRAQLDAAGVPEEAEPSEPKPLLEALRGAGVEITPEIEDLAAPPEPLPPREERETPPLPESPPDPEGRALVEARLAAGEPLTEMDLTGVDLSDMDLSGQDLTDSVLAGADLAGVNFVGATLSGCNLQGARLTEANLERADLSRADLTRANLSAANLREANVEEADFEEAEAVGVQLYRARAAKALFTRTRLSGAVLSRTDYTEADFVGADLCRVDATESNFTDATLEDALAEGAQFERSRMWRTRGEGLRARGARFGSVDAGGSFWERADLRETDFSFSHLEQADFSDASLVGAELDGCHLKAARFERAKAHGLRMRKADAMEASFQSADLTRADLRGSNLYAADFWRATTTHVQLELSIVTLTLLER